MHGCIELDEKTMQMLVYLLLLIFKINILFIQSLALQDVCMNSNVHVLLYICPNLNSIKSEYVK